MRYLIVNADDFGASCGINRGIMEAHQHSILTSTSLLVDAQCAEEAAALSSYLHFRWLGEWPHWTVREKRLSRYDDLYASAKRLGLI